MLQSLLFNPEDTRTDLENALLDHKSVKQMGFNFPWKLYLCGYIHFRLLLNYTERTNTNIL